MASYTMELRNIIEMYSQTESLSSKDVIEKGRTKLFDFDYPIFDVNYKKVFETHFIRKFYMREIGFETEGLFKFNLETWLSINMPYFNKLFESELLTFDPFINSKMNETSTKTGDKTQSQDSSTSGSNKNTSTNTSNGTATQDNFNRDLTSNNPDSRLAITTKDGEGVIEYASSIEENSENNKATSTASGTANSTDTTSMSNNTNAEINETEDFISSKIGKTGDASYSKMLGEYRDSFIRIENKIFNEMQELFMLVY